MKKILAFCFALCTLLLHAQNENRKWYFGLNAGIDFSTGTATVLTGSVMQGLDYTTTACDAAGNLQFYATGTTVYNRNHTVMSNGSGLLGNISGGQEAVVVPHPGNSNLYYLFTCDLFGFANGLRYNIIDMSQQSGLGAVTATKNVLLYTPCTEKILAVRHCNGRDYWLITHAWQSDTFKVYLIDQNGLNTTPQQFVLGSVHIGGMVGYWNATGQMTVNKAGDRIALTIYDAGLIELFNFDASTGAITSPISISSSSYQQGWGLEFSPNSRYLYLTKWTQAGVWQFDLISNNAATIAASMTSVGTVTGPNANYKAGYLKLAPDDKIYIAKFNSNFLAVINNPDQPAATCGFVDNGFNLGTGISQVGLCNTFVQDPAGYNASIAYAPVCAGLPASFALSHAPGAQSVLWNFGDPSSGTQDTSSALSPTHTYASNGTYNVTAIVHYLCITDTMNLSVPISRPVITVSGSQPVCPGDTFHLTASGATNYLWLPANLTGNSVDVSPSQSGTISVIGTNANGCSDTEQVYLQVYPTENISIHGSPIMCMGEAIGLTATGVGTFTWAPSTGLSSTTGASVIASPTVTTTYTVTVVDTNGCTFSGTYTITVQTCTGMAEASGNGMLQVLPNPGSGLFTLYTGAMRNDATWRLEIFDARGRRVFSDAPATATEIQLDLRSLPDGIYLLVADSETVHAVTRLIIAR